DLINGYYKAGGGTWEGASRAARAAGHNLNALVRDRQGSAMAPGATSSSPSTSGSGNSSGGTSANPGTSGSSGTQGTQGVNDAPAAGSVNERIANATRAYMGTSTRSGPDGGNLACAWAVNNIMTKAGLHKIGSNPNGVASVESALKNGKGTRVDNSQAKPGDIVIWPAPQSHIGIYMGNGKVANNSSSKASFSNMSNLPAGARVYRVNG
ncbi:MAG TPA: NlpC/P60 family protein, partial [Myxococcota bacterium]